MNETSDSSKIPARMSGTRSFAAVATGLLVLGYLVAIVTGRIPKDYRLDPTSLGVVAVGVLVIVLLSAPQLLLQIKKFEFGQLKIQMEEVQKEQEKQQDNLSLINLVMPFLLPDSMRNYLRLLKDNAAVEITGNHDVRSDLRKLVNAGLIQRQRGKRIGIELADGKRTRLSTFLELKPFGRKWIVQIERLEKEDAG